jgi:4-amino-4-deoxy-L-arabinose transferase-like glycosyltransferase
MKKILEFITGLFRSILQSIKSVKKESIAIACVLLAAFIVRIAYLSVTPYTEHSHDVLGHVQYIEYIAQKLSLPARDFSDQTYHPPLYYIVSAVFYKLFALSGISVDIIYKMVQFLSVIWSMGFLVVVSVILKRYFKNKFLFVLSMAVLAFWPSLVIHSVRIGNDSLFFLFYALSLLFIIKWYDDRTRKSLLLLASFVVLTILTKANGIMLIGHFGLVALFVFFTNKEKGKFIVSLLPVILVLTVSLIYTFGLPLLEMAKGNKEISLIGRGAGLPEQLFVGNEVKNILGFDCKNFIDEPFTSPWDDQYGRQYFLNYFFKTGLFGEFMFDGPLLRNAGMLISILFLGILALNLFGLFSLSKNGARTLLPLLVHLAVMIGFSIVFRVYIPASCSMDFRYALPIVAGMGVLYARACEIFREKDLCLLKLTGYGIGLLFAATSIVFILGVR